MTAPLDLETAAKSPGALWRAAANLAPGDGIWLDFASVKEAGAERSRLFGFRRREAARLDREHKALAGTISPGLPAPALPTTGWEDLTVHQKGTRLWVGRVVASGIGLVGISRGTFVDQEEAPDDALATFERIGARNA